jgi:hypothetical protein
MACWNCGAAASTGPLPRNSTMRLLRPAPNSLARRSETCADSELRSNQPPELNSPDVRDAKVSEAMPSRTAMIATGRRKR